MPAAKKIRIEVVFAERDRQQLVELQIRDGATVGDAVEECRQRRLLPESAFRFQDYGIFGEPVSRSRLLEAGDRVEIYRPLEVDPKEARRRRARTRSERTERRDD